MVFFWFSAGAIALELSLSCRKTVCIAMRRMKLRLVYIEMVSLAYTLGENFLN